MNIRTMLTTHFRVPTDINIVYSKVGCPHCARAKELLAAHHILYQDRSIQEKNYRRQLISLMKDRGIEEADITTPEIWFKGEYIGGADALEQYLTTSSADDNV